MSGQLQYDSGRLWALCLRGYAHLHRILPNGYVEKTWPVYHGTRGDALVQVGGLALAPAGPVLADRGLACLHVVPWPQDNSLLCIAQTVDLSARVSEVVGVSIFSDGRFVVCSERTILFGDANMVHFAALPAIPSQQGMLLDIQCTGHSIVAVANVPGRVYAMNPEETCQWRELQLEAGFEPVLCAAVGSGFALLGRHGGYWAVSSNGAKAVQILIPQGMVPIGFAWFDDRWGIVCEKERSPDQEIIICDSSGILLARVVLP